MADGFENAFKAFILNQQTIAYTNSNSSGGDDDEDDNSCESKSEPELNTTNKPQSVRNDKQIQGTNVVSGPKDTYTPIPKLKLMVDPDYIPQENLSPFSLKRYIRSPNTHVVKLDSYSNDSLSKSNHRNASVSNDLGEKQNRLTWNSCCAQGTKKVLFPLKIPFNSVKNFKSSTPGNKFTYQAQIVLKKYGLQYPARNHNTSNSVKKLTKSFSKDIRYRQMLSKHSDVNKTECDSHYFCAQGDGLSRNSPEAAKSVISSPANASVGESSLTDSCVSPTYDSASVTTSTLDIEKHYTNHDEILLKAAGCIDSSVKETRNESRSSLDNDSKCEEPFFCGIITKSHVKGSELRGLTLCSEEEADFTDIVSKHLNNQFDCVHNSCDRESKLLGKRKRNCSEIDRNHDPDAKCKEELINLHNVERKRRTRLQRYTSCVCCVNKEHKYTRRKSIKCNMSNYKNLSETDQKFIQFTIQLFNLQNKVHSLFCSVFPKLVPLLDSVAPESQQFQQIIDDILNTLQTSDDQELQNDTISVVHMFEDLQLKGSNCFVPIYESKIHLCQSPEHCLIKFRDKVISLLQLLLPSLIISLDSFLTTTKDLENFLDKVISSNCVKQISR